MQIEYGSDWMRPTIELMKCLGLMGKPSRNKEMSSIDYLMDNKDGKKLIRAIVDKKNQPAPVYVNVIRETIEELEEKKYDEAIILSTRIITPNMKNNFSLIEVLSALQNKTVDLCKIKCGKAPETKDDCKGKNGRTYDCDIRRISDDATFHAKMKWKTVLLEDFNNLCEVEKEMKINLGVN